MAAINDLIQQIEDKSLRDRIQQEVDRLTKQKKFGLVFEEHLPECTPLYDVPIKIGSNVALKSGKINELYVVRKIDGESVICERKDTHEAVTFAKSEVVSIAQLGEAIYPYLKPIDSVCNAPDSGLWHTLIEADNYHALQLLEYLYAGKVDCIYIDPPYNTGDTANRDWKYNNNYVDKNDEYRHSKWLSMMQKRLKIAKKLLNKEDSVLIVTIDEREYLHLGCLLEELFPYANIQMVTSVISGKGVSLDGQFSRVEEYIFILTFGKMRVIQQNSNMLNDVDDAFSNVDVEFIGLRRRNTHNVRTSRPNQFYPFFVDENDGHIVEIGDVIGPDIDKDSVKVPEGCVAIWPLDPNGGEKIWGLVPESSRELLKLGCIKIGSWNSSKKTGTVKYWASGDVDKLKAGDIEVKERDKYGTIIRAIYKNSENLTVRPRKVWHMNTHNASTYGTLLLGKILGDKRFSFPKSLYAVRDTLKFFVADKPNALILDFFAGSGTTLHAVNLLNAEDGGKRRCILVTNNEVPEPETKKLIEMGLNPGDKDWEKFGIAQHVTWPRTVCSINGQDINGTRLNDNYISNTFSDEIVNPTIKRLRIPSGMINDTIKKDLLMLMKDLPIKSLDIDGGYAISEKSTVTILFTISCLDEWIDAIINHGNIDCLYVVTDSTKDFNYVKQQILEYAPIKRKHKRILIPMSDGFQANAAFFKLGFLDKTSVALGRQFKELIPILWLKAGAQGPCPTLTSEDVPNMLILPKNNFAVLVDDTHFSVFEAELQKYPEIETIYIVTDSDAGYREMIAGLQSKNTYQLYKDYLDNFRINIMR